jgi:hypothetical protein
LKVVIVIFAAVTLWSSTAAGQGVQETIQAAQRALESGEFAYSATLAGTAVREATSAADKAEANRLLGLALFFTGDRAGAESAFVRYLELDSAAALDPALVPPEAVVFFSQVA